MSNPFEAPQFAAAKPQAPGNILDAIRPLYEASVWLRFIGWVSIIMGVLYCLTIIGIIFGWLPIWIGILLKGAGEKIPAGFASNNLRDIHNGCQDLKTTFVIVGVLTIINLVVIVLYLLFAILAFVVMGSAALAPH